MSTSTNNKNKKSPTYPLTIRVDWNLLKWLEKVASASNKPRATSTYNLLKLLQERDEKGKKLFTS